MKNHTRQEIGAHLHGESPIPPPQPAKNLLIPLPPRKIPLNQIFVPPFPPTKSQFPPINNFQVITQ